MRQASLPLPRTEQQPALRATVTAASALLTCEDPPIFAQLKIDLETEDAPQTATEMILINSMAESHWLSQRARKLHAACRHPDTGEITDSKLAALYLRYQTTHSRAFHKSLNDLLKLRKEKRADENGFEAQKRQQAKLAIRLTVSNHSQLNSAKP